MVDGPEGYQTELTSDLGTTEGQVDVWLLQGSERFAHDHEVSEVLIKLAREKNTRGCLLLVGEILNTPGLADRLYEALTPEGVAPSPPRPSRAPAPTLPTAPAPLPPSLPSNPP